MIQDLTQKQIQLLSCLMRREYAISAQELAKRLGISARTVLRYISVLNGELRAFNVQIVIRRGQGYELEGNRESLKYLVSKNEAFQTDGCKRVHEMILEIIDQDEVTLEKLGETMFLSPSTLTKLTAEVKSFLKEYHLTLSSKPYYGLSISGEEMDIRTLLGDIGLDYCNACLINTGIYNISEQELEITDQVVFRHIQEYGMVVADMDLNHLSARIIIALSRSRKRRYVSKIQLINPITGHNYQMVRSMLQELGERFSIKITEDECRYVMACSGFIGYDFNLSGSASCQEMLEFVSDFLTEISELTGICYERDERIMSVLSVHLKALMQRAQSGNYSPNPIISQIKSNYPLEMNYAILMAQRFEERFGVTINEDEIGYLTVYLGVYQARAKERIKAVILCNYGIGTSQMILEKLQNEIQDVQIFGVYPVRYLSMAVERHPDVVISAVHVEGYSGNIPLIVAQDLLDERSIRNIQEKIWQRINIERELMGYFDSRCFKHIYARDRFEAIAQLGALLQDYKAIGKDVIEAIEKRERISSTEVGNLVAVPHVLWRGDFCSCIAIGILEKPIVWGSEMVQMIFLACFHQSSEQSSRIFRTLYQVIRSDKLVHDLVQSRSFEEFKNILCREIV